MRIKQKNYILFVLLKMYIFCTITIIINNCWGHIDPEAQKCKQEAKTI